MRGGGCEKEVGVRGGEWDHVSPTSALCACGKRPRCSRSLLSCSVSSHSSCECPKCLRSTASLPDRGATGHEASLDFWAGDQTPTDGEQ